MRRCEKTKDCRHKTSLNCSWCQLKSPPVMGVCNGSEIPMFSVDRPFPHGLNSMSMGFSVCDTVRFCVLD